jgi:hypothetical protein
MEFQVAYQSINPNAIFKLLIAKINANFVYFTKNDPHLKKKIENGRPKSRLKGDFFNKKATKKPTKFR